MWYQLVVRPSKFPDKWKICEAKWDDHDNGHPYTNSCSLEISHHYAIAGFCRSLHFYNGFNATDYCSIAI